MEWLQNDNHDYINLPGDWTVSIMYEGQHIQGSPFNVRVYDAAQVKVFGLEGGSVGKTFSFSGEYGIKVLSSCCWYISNENIYMQVWLPSNIP